MRQNPALPVPYSLNNELYLAYREVDEIIQTDRPHLSFPGTFKITPPVPDVLNPGPESLLPLL
jgi:hypothetical protein